MTEADFIGRFADELADGGLENASEHARDFVRGNPAAVAEADPVEAAKDYLDIVLGSRTAGVSA